MCSLHPWTLQLENGLWNKQTDGISNTHFQSRNQCFPGNLAVLKASHTNLFMKPWWTSPKNILRTFHWKHCKLHSLAFNSSCLPNSWAFSFLYFWKLGFKNYQKYPKIHPCKQQETLETLKLAELLRSLDEHIAGPTEPSREIQKHAQGRGENPRVATRENCPTESGRKSGCFGKAMGTYNHNGGANGNLIPSNSLNPIRPFGPNELVVDLTHVDDSSKLC